MKAYCTLCRREFSVARGCLSDVKQHVGGSEHKKNDRSATTSAATDTFFAKVFSVEHQKVLAAELTSVYHAIQHNQSYASTDCLNKLVHQQFSDSEIAKKVSCRRTKSKAIVKEVLGPKFLNDVLCDLKQTYDQKLAYFGLAVMHRTGKTENCLQLL